MLPALIERARREVVLARVVGKYTVDVGFATVRRRLTGDTEPVSTISVDALVDMAGLVDEAVGPVRRTQVRAEPEPSSLMPEQLVLPDYDLLPASHIVAKLASLTRAERDAVEEYETAHRHRRTILGKLDQLRADP